MFDAQLSIPPSPVRLESRKVPGDAVVHFPCQPSKGDDPHEKPVVELGPTEDVTFRDAAAATEYIVSRAKGLIDGDESALLLPGQLRS